MRKWTKAQVLLDNPDHFVACSSFPPFVWELMERAYPNRLLCASRDLEAIRAASRLMTT